MNECRAQSHATSLPFVHAQRHTKLQERSDAIRTHHLVLLVGARRCSCTGASLCHQNVHRPSVLRKYFSGCRWRRAVSIGMHSIVAFSPNLSEECRLRTNRECRTCYCHTVNGKWHVNSRWPFATDAGKMANDINKDD